MEFLISKTSDSRLDTTDFRSEMEAFPFEESPLKESNMNFFGGLFLEFPLGGEDL